jgi:hypothetical protein
MAMVSTSTRTMISTKPRTANRGGGVLEKRENRLSAHRLGEQRRSGANRVVALIAAQASDYKALFLAPIFYGPTEPIRKRGDRFVRASTPTNQIRRSGPIGSRASHYGERSMSHENATAPNDRLQSLAAKLERRRNKIAKAQRSFEVIVGAYDLVLADLRAADSGSDPAGESTTA